MTVEKILREAIQGEIEAHLLYTEAADMVQEDYVKQALRELAQEEQGHRFALERMLVNPDQISYSVRKLQEETVEDYQIGDHLVAQPLGPNSTFQDVCIFASKKEQQSYELYRDMAAQNEGELSELLEAMAKDELRHKNLVEGWYEEVVYQEF